jgi:hypothetical protein
MVEMYSEADMVVKMPAIIFILSLSTLFRRMFVARQKQTWVLDRRWRGSATACDFHFDGVKLTLPVS